MLYLIEMVSLSYFLELHVNKATSPTSGAEYMSLIGRPAPVF